MFKVYFQNKLLKTPQGHAFQVPTSALANAIEREWTQNSSLDYRQKPLTALAATSLDYVTEAKESYIKNIIESVPNDVILFWSSTLESLVKLQQERWEPIIEETNQILGVFLKPTPSLSIMPLSLKEEKVIKKVLEQYTAFELAGLSHLIALTSSFSISFLAMKGGLSPKEAWDLSQLHEHEQRRIWGEDSEAVSREKSLQQEFFDTLHFLELCTLS